ncbi:MAG: hypothetical protein ACK59B_12030, partial [Alphaproteobacteria bacterium]
QRVDHAALDPTCHFNRTGYSRSHHHTGRRAGGAPALDVIMQQQQLTMFRGNTMVFDFGVMIVGNPVDLRAPQRRKSPVEENSTHVDIGKTALVQIGSCDEFGRGRCVDPSSVDPSTDQAANAACQIS